MDFCQFVNKLRFIFLSKMPTKNNLKLLYIMSGSSTLFSGCYKFILISSHSTYFTSLIKLIFTHFYRTVLTHVEKSLYCYLLFHLCMASPLFNIRRYTGPFPEWLCWWMKLLVNFVPNCLFFSFCVNIILRVSIF